jgi:flagellar hook-associated protein 1 FlgK
MANGMGSLYIGATGLKSSQTAINTTANNLANLDTTGYVRQQVLFGDLNYLTFDTNSAISHSQAGLGVTIADVVHTRDYFLDKSYRTEAGRQSFYAAGYSTTSEVETYYQELEGQAFQDNLEDFWTSFQEFAKDPSDSANQNLIMQKATLFASRAQSVYSSLQGYQNNINTQVSDDVDSINDLGHKIYDLNLQISKVEAGGVETAMALRDERDNALDKLSTLANITYKEQLDGSVRVKLEGVDFVDESHVYDMGKEVNKVNGFITPYWPHMSDIKAGKYSEVFNYDIDISSEKNTDIGELKALVMQRGDHVATYADVEGKSADDYNHTTGMSTMLTAEAQLDQLIHGMVTAINDAICPNVKSSAAITGTDEKGNAVSFTAGTLIMDTANCSVGSDGKIPPAELFTRIGSDRYTKVAGSDGKTYYVYNKEDTSDTSKMYTTKSIGVNSVITAAPSLLTYKTQSGAIDYALGKKFCDVWSKSALTLSPNSTGTCTFAEYYSQMVGELATAGSVYDTTATSLQGTVTAINNQRQQVTGVASDEELTNMIKYQNAYNAASRYINVVSDMMQTLISSLGK